MVRYQIAKPKAYKNSKIQCPCGGHYTDAVYKGSFYNEDPQTNHEKTKMHQEYVANGNKMSTKIKEKLETKAKKELAEKAANLALKRVGQVHCGCGSYYNNNYHCRETHLCTAKHMKWEK